LFIGIFLYLPFARDLFQLQQISFTNIIICIGVAAVATLWVDGWKLLRHKQAV
jgi:hypothetical protein